MYEVDNSYGVDNALFKDLVKKIILVFS